MPRASLITGGLAATAGALVVGAGALAGAGDACAMPPGVVDPRFDCAASPDSSGSRSDGGSRTDAPLAAPPAGGSVPAAAPQLDAPCTDRRLLRAVAVAGGERLGVRYARPARGTTVRISVFQSSTGGSVVGERLVFRGAGGASGLRWDGARQDRRRPLADGVLFVRVVARRGSSTDVRRFALRRTDGRFAVGRAFARRESCGVLRSFKLERPALGGRRNRAVSVSFRLGEERPVVVELRRGGRTVRRLSAAVRRAGLLHRVRVGAEGLEPGRYEVRLRAGDLTSSVFVWRIA